MFVLGNRRRWKEPPSCLAQLRAEKRLWSTLHEFGGNYVTALRNQRRAHCQARWVPCPQPSCGGTSALLNLAGSVRCAAACTTHRDPDMSWLWKPVSISTNSFLSAKYLLFLGVRSKRDGERVLNPQAYLHVVSHLALVNPEVF